MSTAVTNSDELCNIQYLKFGNFLANTQLLNLYIMNPFKFSYNWRTICSDMFRRSSKLCTNATLLHYRTIHRYIKTTVQKNMPCMHIKISDLFIRQSFVIKINTLNLYLLLIFPYLFK